MKKRILAGLLCCLLTMGTLAGCGSQQDTGSAGVAGGNENTESSQVAEGSENKEGTEASASEEETVIPEVEITMKDVSPMDLVKEMKIGWNLGNTLDATSSKIGVNVEMAWGNPKTTQEMIDTVIDQGFNVIRIPVSWGGQMGGAPTYNVLPAWMDRVQEVVD